ncbi:MAG: hypothetical protein ABIH83_02740, partial [Candidatus Micrarchaeota archaeon]
GELADDANACGCPGGQQMAAGGKTCEARIGCRWGTKPCAPGYECTYMDQNEKDDGTCKQMQGCVWGTVKCTSIQYCDTEQDENGMCVTKEGCQYDNPSCGSGFLCNTMTGECELAPAIDTEEVGGTANTVSSEESICCCMPAVAIAGFAGFVLYRRYRK